MAVGNYALYTNSGNSSNTAVGFSAGYSLSSLNNTMIGNNAGYYITSGAKNTVLGNYNGNQGGLDIRTASNYIVLSDGDGNPRGVFDGSGNYLLQGGFSTNPGGGTTNGCAYLANGAIRSRAPSNYSYFALDSTSGTNIGFYTYSSGAVAAGSITSSGSTTLYNATSDYRLKTVIGAVAGSGQRIDALQPVEYTWNSDGSHARGFLAHQFQEVYAGSVNGTKDAVDAEGKPVYQSMQASTSEVIADLVAEIQSLRKRLAAAGIA